MKKFRKGFTLLELLVVIGVMGILSSTAMIAGQQATDAARATNIADGLEKAASAMMMYYSDNADTINESGATAAVITAGANAYLKTKLADSAGAGKYFVALSGTGAATDKWFVAYQFLETDTALKAMIANKSTRMNLKASNTPVADDPDTTDVDESEQDNPYTNGETVYMLVR